MILGTWTAIYIYIGNPKNPLCFPQAAIVRRRETCRRSLPHIIPLAISRQLRRTRCRHSLLPKAITRPSASCLVPPNSPNSQVSLPSGLPSVGICQYFPLLETSAPLISQANVSLFFSNTNLSRSRPLFVRFFIHNFASSFPPVNECAFFVIYLYLKIDLFLSTVFYDIMSSICQSKFLFPPSYMLICAFYSI